MNEQLRCLDYRVETQISVVGELQDFFRRRAEVELDYSKNLDKLSKSLLVRHREQKQKYVVVIYSNRLAMPSRSKSVPSLFVRIEQPHFLCSAPVFRRRTFSGSCSLLKATVDVIGPEWLGLTPNFCLDMVALFAPSFPVFYEYGRFQRAKQLQWASSISVIFLDLS